MRRFFAAVLMGILVTSTCAGATLVNGDFENTDVDYGWAIYAGTSPVLAHDGLIGGSTQAAYFSDDIQGTVHQVFGESLDSQWEASFLFASEAPGSDRSLHFGINNETSPSTDLGILMILDPSGILKTYGGGWQPINTTPITFSVDANVDNDFSDAGDTLNVYSILIRGDYSTASPSYDVYLSAANSETLTLIGDDLTYFVNTPTENSAPGSLVFCQQSQKASYVVDNVVVQSVPEPSTMLLVLGGLGMLLCIRRRRA